MTRYNVRFETTATVYTDFEVDADDEEDALKKARERCGSEGPSWEVGEVEGADVDETVDIVETYAQKRARWAEQRKKNQDEQTPTVGG